MRVIQMYTKRVNLAGLYFPHFTTFPNQTLSLNNFKMFFIAVMIDFVLLAKIKIYSIARIILLKTKCNKLPSALKLPVVYGSFRVPLVKIS